MKGREVEVVEAVCTISLLYNSCVVFLILTCRPAVDDSEPYGSFSLQRSRGLDISVNKKNCRISASNWFLYIPKFICLGQL